MLPIPSNTNQEGCNPISSNCVIWQGPDIPCINLCRGDSISDVTAKLAAELCDLLGQLDVQGFNLDCFDLSCVNLTNIHDLIQFILDQLCSLTACCAENNANNANNALRTANALPGFDCPDCTVSIAQCFWYFDSYGNQITTMNIKDYAVAIGNRVCSLVTQITNINTTIANQQVQIDYILANYAPVPPVTLPTFSSTCLTDKIPTVPPGGISLVNMVNATQQAFCELRAATGFPSALTNGVNKECAGLDTSPSLTYPGTTMSSLPGWVNSGSYSTVADAINNMWITLCDLRSAVRGIQTTCCNTSCDDVSLMLQLSFNASTGVLTFYWTGSATGFQDCVSGVNTGSFVTVTDAYGNFYNFYVPVLSTLNVNYNVNLTGTPLNLSTNLSVNVNLCVVSTDGLINCQRCIEQTVTNSTSCQPITLSATSSTVTYQIVSSLSGSTTFQIDLRKQGNSTIVDTFTSIQTGPATFGNTFLNLLPSTVYNVTVTLIVGGVTTAVCPAAFITTGPLNCNQPTNIVATNNQYIS